MTNKPNQTNFEEAIEGKDTILKTRVNCGLILHMPLSDADKIKQLLIKEGCKIVYQRISTRYLWICEDKNDNSDGMR